MHLSQGRGWGWRERDGGALPYEMEIRSGSSIDSAVTPGLLVALVCVVKSPSKPLTVWVFQLQCRSEVKEQGHSEASACRGSRTSCESKPARLNVLRAALYFLTFSNGKLLTFFIKHFTPPFWSNIKACQGRSQKYNHHMTVRLVSKSMWFEFQNHKMCLLNLPTQNIYDHFNGSHNGWLLSVYPNVPRWRVTHLPKMCSAQHLRLFDPNTKTLFQLVWKGKTSCVLTQSFM